MAKRYSVAFFCIFTLVALFVWQFGSIDKPRTQSRRVDYQGNSLLVQVDGNPMETLPVSGNYYLTNYTCDHVGTVISWNRASYELTISNKNQSGSISCDLTFESKPKLSMMDVGSYVSFVGNNGCEGEACRGVNPNYVSIDDMGYCADAKYKYTSSGYRIAYTNEGTAYLISGGAVECVNILIDGGYETDAGASAHLKNLRDKAFKYCNKDYAYGGECNSNSVWNINQNDFYSILKNVLSSTSCYNESSNYSCGYNNDLIDIGGAYWFSVPYETTAFDLLTWDPLNRYVSSAHSNVANGIRPVLRLDSEVVVIDGDGTVESPYIILNEKEEKEEDSIV